MFRIRTILLLNVMCIQIVFGSIAAAATVGSTIRVTIYNDARIPRATLKRAEEVAERIYRQSHITIDWQDGVLCPNATVSFESRECLTLRIVDSPRTLSGEDFGVAFIGDDGRAQQADIFFSSIKHFREASPVSTAALLGDVMAHELGHLLLGQNSHSYAGIMQARWAATQLRQLSMGTLAFDKNQSDRIRIRLADYIAVQPNMQWQSSTRIQLAGKETAEIVSN